jgi:hypothetical protein
MPNDDVWSALGATQPIECFRNAMSVLRILVSNGQMLDLRVTSRSRLASIVSDESHAGDRLIRHLADDRDVDTTLGQVAGEKSKLTGATPMREYHIHGATRCCCDG